METATGATGHLARAAFVSSPRFVYVMGSCGVYRPMAVSAADRGAACRATGSGRQSSSRQGRPAPPRAVASPFAPAPSRTITFDEFVDATVEPDNVFDSADVSLPELDSEWQAYRAATQDLDELESLTRELNSSVEELHMALGDEVRVLLRRLRPAGRP